MNSESIVVCGSGIVGLASTLALARAGLRVSLVGPAPAARPSVPDVFDARVYAISVASRQFLKSLGVWDMVDAARVSVVDAMEVHGDAGGQVSLRAWQGTQDALAWIIESSELERVLAQAVRLYGVAWHAEKFDRFESGSVVTDKGRSLPAGLVVGADGAASPVRTAFGIGHDAKSYGSTGVVAHLTAQRPHLGTAMQWFMGDSVLALLPMPDTADGHQVSMVWSLPDAQAASLRALDSRRQGGRLEAQLQSITGGCLGSLAARTELLGFPLVVDHSAMVAPGAALVGDAAHRVHPLAGQGLNLGLADARALVQVLLAKEPYRAVGDVRVLQRYRRLRAEPLLAMRLATDGLYRLFAAKGAPAMWARNTGMRLVERLPMVKRHLIANASENMS